MMLWSQLNFQDSNSYVSEDFIFFYDFIMLILIVIISFVGILMLFSLFNKFLNVNLLEHQMLESIWTVIPGVILLFIALPSLSLLYLFEESYNHDMTVKAIGHQWYWEYEFSNSLSDSNISWDSYMMPMGNSLDHFRLLDVDVRVILPVYAQIRMLVTSADVLHAWTVPSLGVKADATPGRLNQLGFMGLRTGLFYGQCSEICGANHSFMPIVIEFIELSDFIKWCSFTFEE